MDYVSTRSADERVAASAAILRGIAPDGGLYIPRSVPALKKNQFALLRTMTYPQRAAWLLGSYLTDFSAEELERAAKTAYSSFDTPEVAPVVKYADRTHMLELFHGPTCAFKDVALQLLPHLLTASMRKNGIDDEVCILVATSGDTGKAALEGFADVPGTRIIVFYPENGVSATQKLQMTTQRGSNVGVCAVRGNFDDAQTGVKAIFADADAARRLSASRIRLSSANSINWGRLVPQIVYYVSAYCDLVNQGEIAQGEKINVCVPTGNFGNILAAYFAKNMGLPINRLICASNCNNVLTDFIQTGVYDRRREFRQTVSPSMDILISSNVERLLWALDGRDGAAVAAKMKALSSEGRYELGSEARKELASVFSAGWCDEDDTLAAIAESYNNRGYLHDTHTAVAVKVLQDYRKATGDDTQALIASTASPYKFAPAVLRALGREADEADAIEALSKLTRTEIPAPISSLKGKPVRFRAVTGKNDMLNMVYSILNINLY